MKHIYVIFFVLVNFQVYFGMLDALLAAEELPEEYRDRCQVYSFLTSKDKLAKCCPLKDNYRMN